ncbi:MAG: hypothetical protein ACK5N8_00825 [Alphaproteobacteria bacterium]
MTKFPHTSCAYGSNGATCNDTTGTHYASCKGATCELKGYISAIPDGKTCTTITSDGLNCYTNCQDTKLTCRQWVEKNLPNFTFVDWLSADHHNNKNLIITKDIKTVFTSNATALDNVLIVDESYFRNSYEECTEQHTLEYVVGGRSTIILKDTSIRVPFTSDAGLEIQTDARKNSGGVSFYSTVNIKGSLVANSSVELRGGGFVNTAKFNVLNDYVGEVGFTPVFLYVSKDVTINKLENYIAATYYKTALLVTDATLTVKSFYTQPYMYYWLSTKNSKLVNENGCSMKPTTDHLNVHVYNGNSKLFYNEGKCASCNSAPFCCEQTAEMSCGSTETPKTCENYGYSTNHPYSSTSNASYYYCPRVSIGGLSCYSKSCRLYTCDDFSIGGVDPHGMCAVEGTTNNDNTANQACKNAGYSGKNFTLAIKKSSSSQIYYCYMCYPKSTSSGGITGCN